MARAGLIAVVVGAVLWQVAEIAGDLKAGKIDAKEYLVRVSRLPDPGRAVAVFESPPASGPSPRFTLEGVGYAAVDQTIAPGRRGLTRR